MIQADLYKRSTRNQAGRLRNQTYSAAFKSCRNGDRTPNSPAKLLDTSRIFFCQEPSSTPTTRFWFPTFPILKGKGRQRPHRSPARTAGQLLPQRAAQKKGHCDCWSPTAALLLTKSYLGALGTKPRNAATLGAPHGAEEGTVPQNGDPRSAPSARGGACRARSELPRARTSGCATAELLAARRCRRRSEGPARQLRRRRCSRGCSPAPHPPGRRAATPWQVWGAGGVTWRRCRGLRPPREGRVRWNNHLGPSELPPGSPFGWVAEAGLVLPWTSASSSPQESCGAALCGSGQNARVLRAQ